MSDIIVRPFEPRDDAAFRHIRSMVYRSGDPVSPEDRLLRDDCLAYIAEKDGMTVGSTTVLRMTATKHGNPLTCGGVAAVAVLPEQRRSGVGSEMMGRIAGDLHAKGFAMASLYPYRAAYYRRFGYEHCGRKFTIECPLERFPAFDDALPVRQIAYEERHLIRPAYAQFATRYAGMNLRDKEDQWWRVLGGDTPLKVYACGNPIEGYAIIKLNSGFWEPQAVKELVWNTQQAYRSLLAFMGSLGVNKTNLEWREPADSPFFAEHVDQAISLTLTDNIMYRVLDVPNALMAIQAEGGGEFSFRVRDALIPENEGPWQVCYAPGSTRIERASDAQFELSIGRLTQAFLGDPSLADLLRNGQVEKAAECAAGFFAPDRVYCLDYF